MPPERCPLCGRRGCVMADARMGPAAVRYDCSAHCGSFRIGSAFLHYVWPAVKREDQQALTAYMHATKGPQRVAPLIEGDNYRVYITQGYAYQRLAWTRPRAMAK